MHLVARKALLLIDTNLLVMLAVGAVDLGQMLRFKRTKKYSVDDFNLLNEYAEKFTGVLVTPSLLTEVSNIVGQLSDPVRAAVRVGVAALVPSWTEDYARSEVVTRDPFFVRFGLTDAAIRIAAGVKAMVITDDLPLYLALNKDGVSAENFNHLREQSW